MTTTRLSHAGRASSQGFFRALPDEPAADLVLLCIHSCRCQEASSLQARHCGSA